MMARTQREEARKLISHYFTRYRAVTTALRGRDLLAMGVRPGPIYRVLLDELLDARLNGEVASREEEIARLRAAHPELFDTAPGASAAS